MYLAAFNEKSWQNSVRTGQFTDTIVIKREQCMNKLRTDYTLALLGLELMAYLVRGPGHVHVRG